MGRFMFRFGAVVLVALLLAPMGAQAQAPPPAAGAPPGDKLVAQDSEVCRNAVAVARSPATCTVLYAHVLSLGHGVPLTTQPPTGACPDLAKGVTTVPALPPFFDTARMDLWALAGAMEYPRHGCEARTVAPRGLAADVALDARVPLVLHWFLSADADDVGMVFDPSHPDTGAMPCVEVRVTLQTGRVYGQGEVLAFGSARRTVLSSQAVEAQRLSQFDACAEGEFVLAHHPFLEVAPVHEFPVRLAPVRMPLPRDQGFLVHVEWSQVRDGPIEANQREWNVHGGAQYRNRLVVPVQAPLRMDPPLVERYDQHHLLVNASVQSPWGTYDVDVDGLRLQILDANGHEVPPKSIVGPLVRFAADAPHLAPVQATWGWDFLKARSSPGPYTIRVLASNGQHTHTIVQETSVDVPALLARPAPGLEGALLLAGAAVAVALAARRR